jgi:hypothetical protein
MAFSTSSISPSIFDLASRIPIVWLVNGILFKVDISSDLFSASPFNIFYRSSSESKRVGDLLGDGNRGEWLSFPATVDILVILEG